MKIPGIRLLFWLTAVCLLVPWELRSQVSPDREHGKLSEEAQEQPGFRDSKVFPD